MSVALPTALPVDLAGRATDSLSPCQQCGACCASMHVSFYWAEADEVPGGWVPTALTDPCGAHRRCMRGTHSKTPRCVALQGEVGVDVTCSIYPQRPALCREFNSHQADGRVDERCTEVRLRYGLPPLLPLLPLPADALAVPVPEGKTP